MKKQGVNVRKAAIVGCGYVGSASAFALMQSGLFAELVLIDADQEKAEGEAMDIAHGLSFAYPMKIYAGDYDDLADAAVIVITAGANQKPDESRLDLVYRNSAVMKSIVKEIAARACRGILLIVSNPVDIMTYVAMEVSGFEERRVFGSGTVLDTARLRVYLGERLRVDNRSVHAYIIGEHGDSEIAAWSSANISGVPLHTFCEMRGQFDHEGNTESIEEAVKNSAYEIIEKKHATYFGIAMAVKRICQAIVRDEKSIFPVSHRIRGEYGIEDAVLSTPAIVGAYGMESPVPISLDGEEIGRLRESAEMLRKIADGIDLS